MIDWPPRVKRRERDAKIVGEGRPSGDFFRASRLDPDGNGLTLGPSAGSPAASVTELDRDAGGPVTYARQRLPGEPTFVPHPEPTPAATARRHWRRGCFEGSARDG